MDPQGIVPLVAIALMVLILLLGVSLVLAIRILGRLATRIELSLTRMQEESTAALRQAHVTLERVETLAQSSDQLLREQLSPTLEVTRAALTHVETSARGVGETVEGVQRVVRGLVAITGPGAMAVVTQAVYKRGGKLGLIALGLGAGLRAFFGNGRRQARSTSSRSTSSRRDTDGTRRR